MSRATRKIERWSSGRALAALLMSLAPLAVIVHSADAEAFCRSSTCRSTSTHPCTVDDNGCPADGAKLFWPTSCISYATNRLGTSTLDPEDSRAAIRKAFQAWSAVPCPDGSVASMTFSEHEPVACKKSQYNPKAPNVNVVLFQDSMWKYRGVDATLAKTSVTYSDETGEIFDADIEINSAVNDMTLTDDPNFVDTDLQAVVTHEAGHFIGLAHSPEFDAVMYASYPPHSIAQRYLAADDIAAVCATYPANNGFTCNTVPRNGFSGTCSEPATTVTKCSVEASGAGGRGVPGGTLALVGCVGAIGLCVRRRGAHARAAFRGEKRR